MTTRRERLDPFYGEYVPEVRDIVMFQHAPDSDNRRQQYTITDILWWLGEIQTIRVKAQEGAFIHEYSLTAHDFRHLGTVKVGRKRK